MLNIDYLKLYADASGLRIMLLANRLDCGTETERVLHDWVIEHLDRFIRFTRKGLNMERQLMIETDDDRVADLGEYLFGYRDIYENGWCEEDGYDFWDFVPPESVEFARILQEIHRSLKIVIPGWGLVLPADEA